MWANAAGPGDERQRRPVVEGSYDLGMSLEWEQVIIDARDPAALGRWWCDALGWVVVRPPDFRSVLFESVGSNERTGVSF
jgi:hypothetical protein